MDAEKVKRVAVIGAGTMGHSIAQVFASCGMEVNLADLKQEILDHAHRRVKANLKTLVDYGRIQQNEVPAILGRIHMTTDIMAADRKIRPMASSFLQAPNLGLQSPAV